MLCETVLVLINFVILSLSRSWCVIEAIKGKIQKSCLKEFCFVNVIVEAYNFIHIFVKILGNYIKLSLHFCCLKTLSICLTQVVLIIQWNHNYKALIFTMHNLIV